MGMNVADVRAMMARNGIRQRELAAALGLDQSQVSAILRHGSAVPPTWTAALQRIVKEREVASP